MVVACNEDFRAMGGDRAPQGHPLPLSLDAFIPRYTRRTFGRNLERCLNTGTAAEFEQAFDLPDGVRWWRLTIRPFVPSGSSTEQLLLLTGLDITAKMELQEALKVSTERFESVVDAAYDGIVTIDQEQNITLFNRAAEDLFGYDADEVLGKPLSVLLPPQVRPDHGHLVRGFGTSPVRSRQMDERNRVQGQHRDGHLFPIEIAISKILVGGRMEFTAIIRDIADKVRLLDLLEKQAATDPLTGLANRRAFAERAGRLIREARTAGTAFSVLLLDVDHFKAINDTHGHDVGDQVLRLLATMGARTLRHRDVFGRHGGEEFVVAMPSTDAEQALATGERLRRLFADQDFDDTWSGPTVRFTVSIGVTTLTDADDGLEPLLRRADQALYQAKESGRNRVVQATDG